MMFANKHILSFTLIKLERSGLEGSSAGRRDELSYPRFWWKLSEMLSEHANTEFKTATSNELCIFVA
jgi:hypothetical protein